MDVLSICRICLIKDVNMHLLVNTKLQEIYEKLTAMSFQSVDSQPLQVCYMCYGKLQNCHRLQINCIKSEELFREILANNQFKPKQLLDINTFKIVHPLVQLSCVPVNVEVTHDDEEEHKIEPVNMIHVHVKEEYIEAAQDNITDVFSDKYTTITDTVKIEHITEDDDTSNYSTNTKCTNYNITYKPDQVHIEDVKPDISNVDVKLTCNITYSESNDNNILLKPVNTVSKEADMRRVETSSSVIKDPKLGEKSIRIQNVNKTFETTATNREKNKLNSNENPFKCDICGKCFIGSRHVKLHKRIHTGERPYKCDLCDKTFMRPHHLKYHSRVHTGEKPFKCDICEKSFGLKHTLTLHSRLHTGEKPFKCDVCDKTFNQKSILIHHAHIHTGEKPYKCVTCGKCFRRSQELLVHKRRHTGEKPYKCDTCAVSFLQKHHLVSHCLRHAGKKLHKCDVCEKTFSRKQILKAHQRLHTGEKLYQCDVCEKCFIQKPNLTKHMRLQHKDAGNPTAHKNN